MPVYGIFDRGNLPTKSFSALENMRGVKMLNCFRAKIGAELFHTITLEKNTLFQ